VQIVAEQFGILNVALSDANQSFDAVGIEEFTLTKFTNKLESRGLSEFYRPVVQVNSVE
jgi:hypothetical protein